MATSRIIKRGSELLVCRLTAGEVRERGKALAGVLADIKNESARHDMLKAEMKSAMAALESKRDALQLVVSREEEYRDVMVEHRTNDANLTVERVRMDNGEVVATRPMTEDEKQEKLRLEPHTEAAPAEDA